MTLLRYIQALLSNYHIWWCNEKVLQVEQQLSPDSTAGILCMQLCYKVTYAIAKSPFIVVIYL